MVPLQPVPFGALLRRHRLAAGLTQEELAERAGLSLRAIGALELGERRHPFPHTVQVLATALALDEGERGKFQAEARSRAQPQARALLAGQSPTVSAEPPVGRLDEMAMLGAHAAGKGPPLLALTGAPGIGKSRLLGEAVRLGSARGMVILQGGCRRGGEDPYSPMLQAIKHFLDLQSQADVRNLVRGEPWLVRILPELRQMVHAPLPVGALESSQERRLMFQSVQSLLTAAASPSGLLLVLDDLQWAGSDGLDLLSSLVSAPIDFPARFVVAYRDTEVEAGGPLSDLIADLGKEGLARTAPLRPLSIESTVELVDRLLQGRKPPSDAWSRDLAERTGGVPFFVVSCVVQGNVEATSARSVPWDVGESIRQRMAHLDTDAQALLSAGAVIGRSFPEALLRAVAEQDEDTVVAGLDKAARAQFLVPESDATYRFSHDLVREAILDATGVARQAYLHRRTGRALERRGARNAELAWHFRRGHDPKKALTYALAAGAQALGVFAPSEALEQYNVALETARALGDATAEETSLEGRGEAWSNIGQYEEALRSLEAARILHHSTGNIEGEARVVAAMGRLHHKMTSMSDGIELAQSTLASLGESASPGSRALLLTVLARLLFSVGKNAESLAVSQHAVHLAQLAGDERTLAEAELRLGTATGLLGNWEHGSRILQGVIKRAKMTGDLETLLLTQNNLAAFYERLGEYEFAVTQLRALVKWRKQLGEPAMSAFALGNLGWVLLDMGAMPEARVALQEALDEARRAGESWFSIQPLAPWGRLCLVSGDWKQAADFLDNAIAAGRRTGNRQATELAYCYRTELCLQNGQPHQALRTLDELPEIADLPAHTAHSLRVEALVILERIEESEALVQAGVTQIRSENNRRVLLDWLRVEAFVLAARNRFNDAEEVFAEALSIARALPTPYIEARNLYDAARVLPRTGNAERTRARLEEALQLFIRLGAARDIDRTRLVLQGL